jgi:hypothetical protein
MVFREYKMKNCVPLEGEGILILFIVLIGMMELIGFRYYIWREERQAHLD